MVMDFKDKFATSWKNRKFRSSLKSVIKPSHACLNECENFRFELICLSLVVIAGLIFHLPISEWLWLIAASAIVLIAEAANTAIENLTDLASHLHSNDFAKKAKDIAAGMVLLAAAFAVIVAGLIFIPRIIALF
ncbi:diacylglycerol kinase family protein [Streptomyces aculeolatus]